VSTRDDQRERVTALLAEHLLATGLGQTSLRQLAKAADVSDRMLLYYFTDKADVLGAAMARVAAQMSGGLAAALPEGTALPPGELVVLAARLTSGEEMRAFMRLWVEVIAAAARGEEPFVGIAGQVVAGFRAWLAPRLDVPPGTDREALAGAIIALIDGLALVDICSSEAQSRAMRDALPGLFGGG
jgi:AcrR family transcriptional regulator